MIWFLGVFLLFLALFVVLALRNPRDNNYDDVWELKRRDEFRDGF